MPRRAARICVRCGAVTHNRPTVCDACAPTVQAERNERDLAQRPGARQRGYGARWERSRRWYLAQHPLCVHCLHDGRVTSATEVDHIEPHRGDAARFWNVDNWQALCKSCHSRKTAREVNARRREGEGEVESLKGAPTGPRG